MKLPKVSIIITTRNEAEHIRTCLSSIQKQIYSSIEVIVVDNHSEDKTKEIARKYTDMVYDAGPERSAQRNIGAFYASGNYVVFLDADMILTPNVIAESVDLCESNDLIGAVLPEKSVGIGFLARCKTLERECYEHVDWIESARFFRKDIFMKIGGYDVSLTGPEDFELPQRVKKIFGKNRVGRIYAYIFHNEGQLSLAELLQKKYYYGMRMQRYAKIRGSKDYYQKQSNMVLRISLYFRHPYIFINDPLHAFGMLGMKFLEMSAMILGEFQGREQHA